MKPIRQFDIYWIDLEPARGVETKKRRPCLVLSSDVLNQGRLLIVAPFLKGLKPRPYAVNVTPSRQNGLDQERRVDLRQMRAIDRAERLGDWHGYLETAYHAEVSGKTRLIYGL